MLPGRSPLSGERWLRVTVATGYGGYGGGGTGNGWFSGIDIKVAMNANYTLHL